MSLGAIKYGSEICREMAASIRRNPLKKDILRNVTISRNGMQKSIGRINNSAYIEVNQPNGYKKLITKSLKDKTATKVVKYPDGSYSSTTYKGMKPLRTKGRFEMPKKDGGKTEIFYNVDGDVSPKKAAEHFFRGAKKAVNPGFEINLNIVFERKIPSITGKLKNMAKSTLKTGLEKTAENLDRLRSKLKGFADKLTAN